MHLFQEQKINVYSFSFYYNFYRGDKGKMAFVVYMLDTTTLIWSKFMNFSPGEATRVYPFFQYSCKFCINL